jgi:hypothetical protein
MRLLRPSDGYWIQKRNDESRIPGGLLLIQIRKKGYDPACGNLLCLDPCSQHTLHMHIEIFPGCTKTGRAGKSVLVKVNRAAHLLLPAPVLVSSMVLEQVVQARQLLLFQPKLSR